MDVWQKSVLRADAQNVGGGTNVSFVSSTFLSELHWNAQWKLREHISSYIAHNVTHT